LIFLSYKEPSLPFFTFNFFSITHHSPHPGEQRGPLPWQEVVRWAGFPSGKVAADTYTQPVSRF